MKKSALVFLTILTALTAATAQPTLDTIPQLKPRTTYMALKTVKGMDNIIHELAAISRDQSARLKALEAKILKLECIVSRLLDALSAQLEK